MKNRADIKLILAIMGFILAGGSNYLAMRVMVQTMHPITIIGFQNLVAGSILFISLLANQRLQRLERKRLKCNVIMASLLIVLSSVLTAFSQKYISSGLGALLGNLGPILVWGLNLLLGREKLSLKVFLGMSLAVGGIYLIYYDNLIHLLNPSYLKGIIAMVTGSLLFAVGIVYSEYSQEKLSSFPPSPQYLFVDISCQMLVGGSFLIFFQLLVQPHHLLFTWDIKAIGTFLYLSLVNSLIGYGAYIYALSRMSSTKVNVFSYVNTVLALGLGWLILDEKITITIIVATALVISGVITCNLKSNKKPLNYS